MTFSVRVVVGNDMNAAKSTANFQSNGIYPPANVHANRRNGFWLKDVNAQSDLSTVAEQEKGTNNWWLDYKNCENWLDNPNSTSFTNPKRIYCMFHNKSGEKSLVRIMFDFASDGRFISKEDLSSLTTALNTLTTERKNAINAQKEIATKAAVDTSVQLAEAKTLRQPVTSFDEAIKTAEGEKSVLEGEITSQSTTITTTNAKVDTLQEEMSKLTTQLQATKAKLELARNSLQAKESTILDLQNAKKQKETNNNAAATQKESDAAAAIKVIVDNMTTIANNCQACQSAANTAKSSANAKPFVIDRKSVV